MIDPFAGEELDPRVRLLLGEFAERIVVVESTARRSRTPKDLDLLLDEHAEEKVRKRVRELGIEFGSAIPGNWTFCEGGYCGHLQVELLPVHRGPCYRTTRRHATVEMICGLQLHVARADHAR